MAHMVSRFGRKIKQTPKMKEMEDTYDVLPKISGGSKESVIKEAVSQKKNLERKFYLATNSLKLMEQVVEEKSSRILKLENQLYSYNQEVRKLKDLLERTEKEKNDLGVTFGKLKENFKFTEKEKNDLLKIKKGLEENIETAEQLKNEHLTSIEELKEGLFLYDKENNVLRSIISQYKEELHVAEKKKRINVLEMINEINRVIEFSETEKRELLAAINKLKLNLQFTAMKKGNLWITEKRDIEAELCSDKDQLKLAKKELCEKNAELEVLKNEGCGSTIKVKEKIAQLEDDIVTLKVKESEFNALEKEYEELKSILEKIKKEIVRLQSDVDLNMQNLSQLKKEMKEKHSELESITKKLLKKEQQMNALKDNNKKLSLEISEMESEKDNLMRKVADSKNFSEEKLKEFKESFEEKMLMEKEQHIIEIETIMKFKGEVERENDKLKEENLKIKEDLKILEEKLKCLDQPETPEVSKRGRKRISDEDFDATKECVSKKMLLDDQADNLSPVQKLANTISTKFKAVSKDVVENASKIGSPHVK